MLWLEMSRDELHGGGDWGFKRRLWAPTHKNSQNGSSKWPFWELVSKTCEGDFVLHLRGEGRKAAFVGYSTVATDGEETIQRPPEPGQWNYARSFYYALLKDFVAFPEAIPLQKTFRDKEQELLDYFESNRKKSGNYKKLIFYVRQSGRLQCLNGAYLSEVDDELSKILFDGLQSVLENTKHADATQRAKSVDTSQRLGNMLYRVGQQKFSDEVRDNYKHNCCFPGCDVAERTFLVGAHIARWADVPELRGDVSNGLCFCLMHDRAFEKGLFTLDRALRIWVDESKSFASVWSKHHLLPAHGKNIKEASVLPSLEALRHHWKRVDLQPTT